MIDTVGKDSQYQNTILADSAPMVKAPVIVCFFSNILQALWWMYKFLSISKSWLELLKFCYIWLPFQSYSSQTFFFQTDSVIHCSEHCFFRILYAFFSSTKLNTFPFRFWWTTKLLVQVKLWVPCFTKYLCLFGV